MKRVASLYLPNWSIDRVRRHEQPRTPPERAADTAAGLVALKQASDAEQGGKQCDAPKNTGWRPGARWARADEAAFDHRLKGKDESAGGADACWAGETRADVARRVAAMPAHQRPPMREMGRRSEAAEHPYKRLPGDDGGKASGWPEPAYAPSMVSVRTGGEGVRPNSLQRRSPAALADWNAMPAIRYPGDGPHPDKQAAKERHCGSNDAGAHVPPVAPFFDTGRSTAGTVARVCRDEARPMHGPAYSTVRAEPVEAPSLLHPTEERSFDRLRTNGSGEARTARNQPGSGSKKRQNEAPSYLRAPAPPLVTVHKVGSRVEIAAVSPEARALGIVAGMALTQVRAATPDLDVRDADPDGDRADLHRLAVALARRWSPVVAISDEDGLFIDLTGVAHLHGGETRMAYRIVRFLARLGIAARIGIADTAGAAWAMARFGDAVVAPLAPGHGMAPLGLLPITALRLDAPAQDLLHRLGVDHVAALAAMPRAPLIRRFGRGVGLRLDQAAGVAAEPLDPVIPPGPIHLVQAFAEPLLTAEPIAHWIGVLAHRLGEALAAAGRGARSVVLAATRIDAAVQTIRIGFARPTRDPAHMLRLIVRRIDTIDPGFGIEALALHVLRADPLGAEALSGDLAEGVAPDLAPLVDAIVNRIGARRVWRTRPFESDVPERSVGAAAPLDPPARDAARLRVDDVRQLDTRTADHPWHPRWPRPVRLLRRPEPIDNVLAELPDKPPYRFNWRGRTHRVIRGDGPERITGEWWRRVAERDAVRDYFQVEDDTGERFWLFRRGDAERAETGDRTWYVHGTFA